MTDSDVLLSHLDASVLTLTINRPEARNAVNLAVATSLGDAIEKAAHDDAVRVVVLTGAGERAFCAGADLKAIARGEEIRPTTEPAASWGFAGYVTHPISKPTLAAVNGSAMGGGLELVLASDLAIASADAEFGLPEVRHGIFAAAGGAIRLPRQIPPKIAMEMLLGTVPITAARAYEVGLVNAVVPATDVLSVAHDLARRIAELPPKAVQAAKRVAAGIVDREVPDEAAAWQRAATEWQALVRRTSTNPGSR